jgi:hypothetical protein
MVFTIPNFSMATGFFASMATAGNPYVICPHERSDGAKAIEHNNITMVTFLLM